MRDAPEQAGLGNLLQLQGIALAQVNANRQAGNSRGNLPIVVVLANPGSSFAYGEDVAAQIVELARDDDHVVGVVGISESREASRAAIGILEDAELPVLAGTVTADRMVDSSAFFYQVAPRNDRVAQVMAAFTHRQATVETGTGPARVARNAVIVMDHSDEYSENLASDLHRHFSVDGHTVSHTFSYAVEDPTRPLPTYADRSVDRVDSFDDLAARICERIEPSRDVVFFTGRSAQFPGLLDQLEEETGCNSAPITIIAGDALTTLVEQPNVNLGQYGFLRLYYASFGSRETTVHISNVARRFVTDYEDAYGGDLGVSLSEPALNYDAFLVIAEAINQVNAARSTPTPALVAAELRHGQIELDGVTGFLTFGSGTDRRVPRDKPVLIFDIRSTDEPVLTCGQLTEERRSLTWSAGYPCPRDPS